jgi:hypothetical protein
MAWNTTGNAGLSAAGNFLGTTDNVPVVFKVNGKEVMRADASGRVGVGVATPQNLLHVGPGTSSIATSRVNAVFAGSGGDAGVAIAQGNGVNVLLQASGAGGFIGTTSNHALVFRTNDLDRMVVHTNGNLQVGPGTTAITATRVNAVFASNNNDAGLAIAQNSGVNVLVQASGAGGFIGTTSNHALVFRTNDLDRMVVHTNGNLQVGRGASSIAASRINAVVASNNPDAGIGIAQNSGVNVLLQASGAGGFIGTTSNHPLVLRSNDLDRVVVQTDGNVRFNGDILLANADCAEDFDVCASADADPGTVMVLSDDGGLQDSRKPYDKRVAGVVSGAGHYRPAIVLDRQEVRAHRKAIALMGKVYCKVDAGHGAIHVGDMLTTSETPGHAMKADDPARAFGAIVGKALRGLDEGRGLIPILVALQ